MGRLIGRRLLFLLPVLFGILVAVFVTMRIVPGDPARLVAASDKIRRELGWQPKFQNIDAITESAWRWHQKFPNGYGD